MYMYIYIHVWTVADSDCWKGRGEKIKRQPPVAPRSESATVYGDICRPQTQMLQKGHGRVLCRTAPSACRSKFGWSQFCDQFNSIFRPLRGQGPSCQDCFIFGRNYYTAATAKSDILCGIARPKNTPKQGASKERSCRKQLFTNLKYYKTFS